MREGRSPRIAQSILMINGCRPATGSFRWMKRLPTVWFVSVPNWTWSTELLVVLYGDRMRSRVSSRRVVVCDSKLRCTSILYVNVFEFQSNIFC